MIDSPLKLYVLKTCFVLKVSRSIFLMLFYSFLYQSRGIIIYGELKHKIVVRPSQFNTKCDKILYNYFIFG